MRSGGAYEKQEKLMRKWMWGLTVGGLLFAGCTQESASDGPVVDTQPEVDVAVPPVNRDMGIDPGTPDATIRIDYCSDEATVDLNTAAVAQDDGSLRYEGEYGTRNTFGGSCGGEGREKVFRFTAPSAGQWSFLSSPLEGSLDTVLYARSTCDDSESELACNDDIVAQVQLDSSLQLTLEQGQLVYLFADTYGGSPVPFFLTARSIPTAALGEVCDREGQRIGCPEGAFCAVEAGTNDDEGICTQDGPPVIESFQAFRNGNTITAQADGRDPAADVTEGRLQLYRGNQRIVLNDQGADTFIIQPMDDVGGQSTFSFRFRIGLDQEEWLTVDRLRFWLTDSRGNDGEAVEVNLVDLPAADPANCDQHRIVDGCAAETACLDVDGDGVYACVEVHAPRVTRVKGFLNENVPGINFDGDSDRWVLGFEARGFDEDNDAKGVRLELYKNAPEPADGEAAGEPEFVARGTFDFNAITSTDGNFEGLLSFVLAQQFDFDFVRVWIYDGEGLESEPTDVASLRTPVDGETGDPCDPVGARAICTDQTDCVPGDGDDPFVCGTAETSCPAEWGSVTEVSLEGNQQEVRLRGDLTNAPNNTRGTCGGGVAQNIYRFTAPTAGKYSFVARERGANTVIYIRRYCGIGPDFPNLERGCSSQIGRRFNYGLVRGALQAGETVYVFVDGDEGWRSAYELVVSRLPDYEEVDF